MFKKIIIFLFIIFTITLVAQQREYYQLKTYSFETDEQQEVTDTFLETSYLPALKRLNIRNVGVFKPKEIDSSGLKKTYVLIPFNTLKQIESLDSLLLNDKTYLKSGMNYLQAAHNKAPYKRLAVVLLKAFIYHPKLKPSELNQARKERVYELRSYESATKNLHKNKVEMFNEGGEVTLFDALEFNAVFYGEVISGASMPNLMYMTTFENQESRDAHWKAFGDSPVWKALKAQPKYQNNVSHIDITFLYPTSYSDY